MDFSYREEQRDVQALSRKILEDLTTNDHQRALDTSGCRFDEKVWSELAKAGLLGLAIDERQGGMGYDFETLCLLVENVGRTVAAVPVIPCLVSACLPLQRFGSARQRDVLSRVASGDAIITASLIEPGNEDWGRPLTQAQATEDGWMLRGTRTCVPFARQAEAVVLSALCDGELLVFLLPADRAGIRLADQHCTSGEPQCEMDLEDTVVSAGDLLARGEDAESLTALTMQWTRAAMAAMATGLCDRMLRMTAQYTSQREQFGVPVATFQAVGHRAADCYIDVEILRLVSQEAISRLTLEVGAAEAVTIAKIWTGDVAHRVSQASQHLHGGIGVDRDYPLFRYCLWARQLELSCGSSARLTEELGTDIALAYTAS